MKIWDMKRTVFTVSDFISWMESGALELSPSFQRRSTWRPASKSLFIDTIVRGLPVPIIFLREKTNVETLKTIREVVDGQQRLRTIISFLQPSLLKDFDKNIDDFTVSKSHNSEIAGTPFKKIDASIKSRILSYQFSVDVLPRDTDDAEVLKVFSRMNSTGMKLTPQEVRNAEFHGGEFHQIVYQTALEQLDRWREWKVFTEANIARMEEAELVSELFMFMLDGISGKTPTSISNAYKKYDVTFELGEELNRRLNRTFDELDSALGELFRFTEYKKKTLFYPLYTAVYNLAYNDQTLAKKGKVKKLSSAAISGIIRASKLLAEKNAKIEILEAASRRTTHKNSREKLHNFIMDSVKNANT